MEGDSAIDTIRDYIDKRDAAHKARSHANEEMWAHNARFRSSAYGGVPYYNDIDGGVATGWHQQTSSLYNGIRWHRPGNQRKFRGRNIGGPFHTRRLSVSYQGAYPHFRLMSPYGDGAPHYFYEGVVIPGIELRGLMSKVYSGELDQHSFWTSTNAMPKLELRTIGERIMLSVVPTSAPANAVVSIGELITEGGFFSTPGKSLLDQNPGGEFLNTQFGILPVVSDAKSFTEAANSYTEIIRQYRRDSGKVVRRKAGPFVIEDTETSEEKRLPLVAPSGATLSSYLCRASRLTITKRTFREVWYSGAFEYHIPENMSRLEELLFEWNRVYGIVPDPADIWNLLPFSWLADWQTNSGNALRHLFLQASEGATQRYGYVMCKSKVTTTYSWRGELRMDGSGWQPHTVTFVVEDDIKQRERVSPFGTAFTGEELTTRQLAILGALGIAK